MCEFCTEHGEGKEWYLQMKNYAEELLYEELTASQAQIANATTRLQWTQRFWESFVLPAITGVPRAGETRPFAAQTQEDWRIEHFGQVRRQRDDALRRLRQFERCPGVVDQPDSCRLHRRCGQQAQPEQRGADHRPCRLPPWKIRLARPASKRRRVIEAVATSMR